MRKFTFTLSLAILMLLNFVTNAADFYWVNGTGNWSDFAAHWATTSGGGTFQINAPTMSDNVYFDANSFALPLGVVTVDVSATCNNMDWTGVTDSTDFAGFSQLDVYGSLTFSPNMTSSYSGWLSFKSSLPGNTVNFSTVPLSINNIEFSGIGSWSIDSDIDISAGFGQMRVTNGSVNFNNHTYKLGMFQSWPMGISRTINLGSCTITTQNFMLITPASLNFNAGTSTINMLNSWFDGQGLTYYDVNFPLTWSANVQINGSNTFHNIGLDSANVTGLVLDAGKIQTINNITFGANCSKYKTVMSNNTGVTTTIKKISGAVNEDFLIIRDITITGGAIFTTNNGINLGNVTNWTINSGTSDDYYWVGGAGDWSDLNHWSDVSGGAPNKTCTPSDVDNVFFDANSFSLLGEILNVDVEAICNNMNWSGVTNSPQISTTMGTEINIFGSLTLSAGMTYGSVRLAFRSNNMGNTITTAGLSLPTDITFEGSGGWQLNDNLTNTGSVYLNQGSFNTNDKDISTGSIASYTALNRTITMGTSTITCGSWYFYDNSNLTINAGTSEIILTGNYFGGGSKIYNNLTLQNTISTTFYDGNTFNIINNSGNGDLLFKAGSTTSFTDLTGSGDCSNLLIIKSQTDGQTAALSLASGTITVNYANIKDISAIGGGTFNANNSIDAGNVTGWNFTFLGSTDYYWIGGAGNWSDPLNWSLSSGGAANAGSCIPTQVDNVFFDGNSGLNFQAVTIDQNAYCNNMDWTGATNSRLNGTNTYTLNIYGSFTFNATALYQFNGNVLFKSDNPGNTIDTKLKIITGNVYFDGSGDWTLQNLLTTQVSSFKSIYINKGTLSTNNFAVTTNNFSSSTTNNRILNFGSSVIIANYWYITNGTNLTINPATSTINVSASYFYGGDADYNNVNLSTTSNVYIYGSNTFNTLNASSCDNLYFEASKTNTFTTLTIPDGISCTNYFNLSSATQGTATNLSMSAGTFTGNWFTITDVTAGGGGTFNANNSVGVGDVTGWNISGSAGVDLYWIGDGGSWSDPLHWSLTSGGASYGCIPTSNDNVFFDANSFSILGQAVDIDIVAYCKNIDWTGAANTPNLTGWSAININGSLTLIAAMDFNYFGIMKFLSSNAGNTITSAGKLIGGIELNGTGEYSLLDDITLSWSGINFKNGTFNTNNKNINISGDFTSFSSNIRTINLGSSEINLSNWNISDGTNMTFNAGTSAISLSTNSWNFNGADFTYYDVVLSSSSFGFLTLSGSNTFNTLTINPASEIRLTAGTTQITNNLIATGIVGEEIILKSDIDGVTASLNQTSQVFCGDYLQIQDITASGTTFYAGDNSTDLGNNSGWTWSGVTAINQYPAGMCEEVFGGGTVAGINLTLLESTIDGGAGSSHSWFRDYALTIPVLFPANVTVSNGQAFYDNVSNGTCSSIAEVIYTVYSWPVLSSVITNVSCNGLNDGSVNLSVISDNPPLTYLWSNAATTQDISSLSPNTYDVTVSDLSGCTSTYSATVTEPTVLNITVDSIINVTCGGANDGAVYCSTSGGTAPYFFTWTNTLQITEDITGLAGNTYDVSVTDINSCISTANATVTEPVTVIITIDSTWNVSCGGANDGAVFTTTTGGSIPYTFIWNTAQTTDDITSLGGNTYFVTITDTNGCTDNDSSTVFESIGLTSGITSTNISCYGENDGNIDLTVSGGASPYSYLWSSGQITEDLINLSADTFFVTVTDAAGCTISDNVIITEPPQILSSIVGTNESCSGYSDGSANLTVSGGISPYSYLWNTGAITEDITTLTAGLYKVTITDIPNGCIITDSIIISTNSSLITNIIGTDATCNGTNDGSADLTVSGGTSPYSYIWSSGVTTQDNINLSGGEYFVTITDNISCWTVDSITINESLPITSVITINDATCYESCDGDATVNPAGGTPPFTFLWSSGGSTNTEINLCAQQYFVTVTDLIGCTIVDSAIIGSLPQIVSGISKNDISCNGLCDGTASVSPTGVSPFGYSWSTLISGTQTFSPGTTGAIPDNSPFVTFTLPVSGLGNLDGINYGLERVCIDITHNRDQHLDISLMAPDGTTVNLSDDNGLNNANYTGTCFTMSAINSIILGAAPFTGDFIPEGNLNTINNGQTGNGTWSLLVSDDQNGQVGTLDNWSLSFTTQMGDTAQSISNLCSGIYNVTITDGNNCTTQDSVTITEPALLTVSASKTDITCNGVANGTIDLTVSGGTTAYSFAWDSGQSTEDISSLAPNTYNVTVTDAGGCTATSSAIITEPAVISVSDITTNVTCNGGSNGAFDLTVSGGTSPYSYLWSNGTTTEDQSGLTAGVYSGTITDTNNCENNRDITITEPFAISISSVITPENTGNDGAINITVSGGTSPYTYLWSNTETTEDITNLTIGIYSVTVTDSNGCIETLSNIVVNNIACTLTSSISGTNLLCNGDNSGTATVVAIGGTSPFTYGWSNAATTNTISGLAVGTYDVTVTDNASCISTASVNIAEPTVITISIFEQDNVSCYGGSDAFVNINVSGGTTPYTYIWTYGQTTEDLSGLSAGTNVVTVTDANGCTATESVIITEPNELISSTSLTNVTCNGGNNGAIDLSLVGGTSPFTYLWSNGAVTEDISGLTAGFYSATATDANGCEAGATDEITQPSTFTANISGTNITCFGNNDGIANLTVTGGVSPFTYLWSNAAVTEDLSGLSAGAYALTVTDANGCTATASINIAEPSVITISIFEQDNVLCYGGSDAFVNINVSGGTTPYTYIWTYGQTTEDLSGLSAGTNVVTVTDANNCTATKSVIITEPNELISSTSLTNVTCNGGNNGTIDLSLVGGTSPFTYLWSNGAVTEDISGLTAGFYSATITDANGCEVGATDNITEPAAIDITYIVTHENAGNDGAIDITVSGSISPNSYIWSNGLTTEDISGLSAGIYSVTVTDNNGCQQIETNIVVNNTACTLTSSISGTNLLCNGDNSGTATIVAIGGTSPFTYSWSNAAITSTISGLAAGIYDVTVTDNAACISTESITLTQPVIFDSYTNFTNISCFGANDGAIDLTLTGGTSPFTYVWTTSATTEDVNGLVAGMHNVTATDANGCVTTNSATIAEPVALILTLTTTDVLCFGDNNGSIDANVSGGTTPYTFAWSNLAITEDLSGISANTYSLSVTDLNNCTISESTIINEPLQILNNVTAVICEGDSIFAEGAWQYVTGTFNDTLTAVAGCDSIIITDLTVNPAILVDLGTDGDTLCFETSETLTLDAGNAGMTFLWSDGSTAQTFVADAIALGIGTHTIGVTVTDGVCTTTDQIVLVVDICSGIVAVKEQLNISMYPNPTKGILNIAIDGLNNDATISIMDISGKVILNETLSAETTTKQVDFSTLPMGIYAVKVTNGDVVKVSRIVLQ